MCQHMRFLGTISLVPTCETSANLALPFASRINVNSQSTFVDVGMDLELARSPLPPLPLVGRTVVPELTLQVFEY